MDDLTVLPPSIWDPNTRLEPPQKTRSMVSTSLMSTSDLFHAHRLPYSTILNCLSQAVRHSFCRLVVWIKCVEWYCCPWYYICISNCHLAFKTPINHSMLDNIVLNLKNNFCWLAVCTSLTESFVSNTFPPTLVHISGIHYQQR